MTLPKLVYVKEVEESNGDKYLDVGRTPFDLAEDEQVTIGVYELLAKKKVKKVVEVIDV